MNKKQLMIELAMPIVFMLVAVYVIVKAIPMESEGVFPIMSAGVLLLCAVYLFVEILIKHQQVVKLGRREPEDGWSYTSGSGCLCISVKENRLHHRYLCSVLFHNPFPGLQKNRSYPVVFRACSCMRILYL